MGEGKQVPSFEVWGMEANLKPSGDWRLVEIQILTKCKGL